jgi:AcrR family transcriptional regulator
VTPRPRKATDDEILAATARVMQRVPPAQLTLAVVAAEAGLTASAVVQRFGSKQRLFATLTERFAGTIPEIFAALRAAHASPLAALRAHATMFAQMGETPHALAHHLAYLQLDLTDPDMHRGVRAQARATRAAVLALLDEAVSSGELRAGIDTTALARAIEVTLPGSLMTWAFYEEGRASDWVLHDLDVVLGPWLA